MLFLKVVMVVSKSQYVWVKNADAPRDAMVFRRPLRRRRWIVYNVRRREMVQRRTRACDMMKRTQCLLASMAISALSCLNVQAAMLDLAGTDMTVADVADLAS